VYSYGDFCPLSRAAEIYATRWTPLIVRNLLFGCRTFTEIRDGLPGISRSVLTQRLRMLEHHGIIERELSASGTLEYRLTEAGEGLEAVVDVLARWGERWLDLAPDHYDAGTVLWSFCKRVAPEELPDGRLVFVFDVKDDRRYWLLLQRPAPEICFKPPGYDEDLTLVTTSEWLTKWHIGRLSLGDALSAGVMELRAPLHLERMLATMGGRGAMQPAGTPLSAARS
jgi:DNA-binding HxlR family transcriptional regulator